MISFVQIAFVVFASFAWSRAVLRLRDKNISFGEFGFWSAIWFMIILIAIFPEIIIEASKFLGIGRGTDLVMYFSIALLFYMVFRLYVRIDHQTQAMTKLVREVAKKEVRKKK